MMKKILLSLLLVIIFFLGLALGFGYQKNFTSVISMLEPKVGPEFFNYLLSDNTYFARGLVDQAGTNGIYLRTSDEMIPLLIAGETLIFTATYPLGNTNNLVLGNFNHIHNADKIDVRFIKINGRNTAIEIIVWTNLRKQKLL